MIQAGASPDEITAALVKNAQGQTPEGQDPVKGLLSAWGNFFGVPLDVVLSNEQMTPQKAAEIISSGVPTSEAKLMQYVAAKAFLPSRKAPILAYLLPIKSMLTFCLQKLNNIFCLVIVQLGGRLEFGK